MEWRHFVIYGTILVSTNTLAWYETAEDKNRQINTINKAKHSCVNRRPLYLQ